MVRSQVCSSESCTLCGVRAVNNVISLDSRRKKHVDDPSVYLGDLLGGSLVRIHEGKNYCYSLSLCASDIASLHVAVLIDSPDAVMDADIVETDDEDDEGNGFVHIFFRMKRTIECHIIETYADANAIICILYIDGYPDEEEYRNKDFPCICEWRNGMLIRF